MKFKNMWDTSEVITSPVGQQPAQQQFKDDTDINKVIARFHKTGVIDHVKSHQPEYGMSNSTDLHNAMNIIAKAESMFMDLSPEVRNKFHGSPGELLDFVQNPDNEQACSELGLALSDEAQAVADARKPVEPPPVDPPVTPETPTV